MEINLRLHVPDEYVDSSDSTGMTEEGYNALMESLGGFDIVSGPTAVT